MNFNLCIATYILILINLNAIVGKRIRKRQIYREHVLPHAGGKIPSSAFHTDRLALNRLQKEGIAIPDGVILEQRNPKVHAYPVNDLRPVFKVESTSDDRYTPSEGQYLHYTQPASETTYPIPKFTYETINFPSTYSKATVFQPIYKPFYLPNPRLKYTPFNPYLQQKQPYSPFALPVTHQTISSPHINYKFAINYPFNQPKWNSFY